MSIIYVATIFALSTMGVGYAAWSGQLNIDAIVKTGNIQGRIKEINNSDLDLEEGEWLTFRLTDDNQNLEIEGEVYPGFNKNIPLKIIDEGSVPVLVKDLHLNNAEITELREESMIKDRGNSDVDEDIVKSYKINIKADNDRDDHSEMERNSSEEEDEISNLEGLIDKYKTEKDYRFEYNIILEQSL